MTYEYSAGAVVFTIVDDNIKYVIIKSRQGYFGFPKGHIERGEDEKTAKARARGLGKKDPAEKSGV